MSSISSKENLLRTDFRLDSNQSILPAVRKKIQLLTNLHPEHLAYLIQREQSPEVLARYAQYLNSRLTSPECAQYAGCCAQISYAYLQHNQISGSAETSENFARAAIHYGLNKANILLALNLLKTGEDPQSIKKALPYLLKAKEAGSIAALEMLGRFLFEEKISLLANGCNDRIGSQFEALKLFKDAEKLAESCGTVSHVSAFFLGRAYREGVVVSRNLSTALEYFKLAKKAYLPALTAYGSALYFGEGTTANTEKGIASLEMAARLGCTEARIILIKIYSDSKTPMIGLAIDHAEELYRQGHSLSAVDISRIHRLHRKLFRPQERAANERKDIIRLKRIWLVEGLIDGLFELADLYRQNQDHKNYLKTLTKMAHYGAQKAQIQLVVLAMEKGRLNIAYRWLLIAIKSGYPDELNARAILEEMIAPENTRKISKEADSFSKRIRDNLSKKKVINIWNKHVPALDLS